MNTTAPEIVSGELVPHDDHTLWRTDDPGIARVRMEAAADLLKDMLDKGGMTMKIGRNEHVLIDGWQTLGSMLGVSPYVVWSRPLEAGNGWEARAEARTVDGRVVGAAEAMCTRLERNWKTADDYAIRSMAQTRAMSKALRGPLGFVITLAGRNPTPAEEMAADTPTGGSAAAPAWAQDIDGDHVNRFGQRLENLLADAGHPDPHTAANDIGERLVKFCEGTIPACCAALISLLAQATTTGGPPVPDPDPEPEGQT